MYHELNDGVKLFYEVSGNADSDSSVVFLNGLSQTTQSWVAITPSFNKSHHIITLDLVFQGQSGVTDEFRKYDEHAADVMSLLDAIGKKNIFLCGISYGSAVAQHLLVNYPERFHGALLLSTFAHNTEEFNAMGERWRNALIEGGYSNMFDTMLSDVIGKTYLANPLIPIETMKESRLARELKTESLLKLMKATEVRGDYRVRLKDVKAKVIVAQGDEDVLIPPSVAQHVADNIPGAEFVVLEKVGHTLNLEAIPQVISLLRRLLRD